MMPQVADLSAADDVVQRRHGLFDRRNRIPPVDLIKVDVIAAQPGQGMVDLSENGLA